MCAGDGALVRDLEAFGPRWVYSGDILAVITANAAEAIDTSTMAACGLCAPSQQNLLLWEKRNCFNNFSAPGVALFKPGGFVGTVSNAGAFAGREGRPRPERALIFAST